MQTEKEYFDELDENGNTTGRQVGRREAHTFGLWHRAAHIWIINSEGEILIQKRSINVRIHPGQWDISAAGHIDAGEDPVVGGLRELFEELGVKAEKKDLVFLGTVKHMRDDPSINYKNREFQDIYVMRLDKPAQDFVLQKEEVDAVKWLPWQELELKMRSKDKDFVVHKEADELLFAYLHKIEK